MTQKHYQFDTVIGLEVHLQFNTNTKIFCSCANKFGEKPNTCVCPVCLGLPGVLPVLNEKVLDSAIKASLALQCDVNRFVKFDRKNYYYPDLPKGYQISQYDFPIGQAGYIFIQNSQGPKKIRIHRAHIEEDAGKLIHDPQSKASLVDYNRTGTPLLEIVTEPDICSPQEAYDYLTNLKLRLEYLEISDCDMEKGSLRCDANISLKPHGQEKLGTKAEIKNLNSFKAVKSALEYEQTRQAKVLSTGGKIIQETRLWDENKSSTLSMRGKEQAHDYRYFPEPDLVPFYVDQERITTIKKTLPEFAEEKYIRLQKNFLLSDYDAKVLVQDKYIAEFFESCCSIFAQPKKICNWILGDLQKELNAKKLNIKDAKIDPKHFADLVQKVEDGLVSNLSAKDVLSSMIDTGQDPNKIIEEKGLAQVSDDHFLEEVMEQIIKENPTIVDKIRNGDAKPMGFLIGQAMKKTQGKGNPKKFNAILKRRISND